MSEIKTIGDVPWSRDDIRASLDEFEALYDKRPIRDNTGGMKAPHMFAVWFMARKLAPETIVESGIWRGQSTWLLEQACPDARIISIDLDLSLRQYISDRAQYSDVDFSAHDWTGIDPDKTLVFFDDHQNAYTRVQQCWWFGFRHVIFEDNYPPSQGDCYSCKKAFSGAGFQPAPGDTPRRKARLTDRIRYKIASVCGVTWIQMIPQYSRVTIPPNQHDAKYLAAHLQTYYEFPPFSSRKPLVGAIPGAPRRIPRLRLSCSQAKQEPIPSSLTKRCSTHGSVTLNSRPRPTKPWTATRNKCLS
jgi:hypothetical protein